MAKLKAPEKLGNVSCEGIEYVIDKDGFVEVPDELVHKFETFGFTQNTEDENRTSKKTKEKIG